MKTKMVYIDGSALTRNSQGGIAQYTRALIEQLSNHPGLDVRVLLFKGDQAACSAPIEYVPIPRRIYMGLWRIYPHLNISRWLKGKPSAVIYPNFSMTPFISGKDIKTITVIHDLTYIHYPDTVEWKNRLFLQFAVKRSCKYSDYIVTPSQFSLDDITSIFKVKGKTAVAYPGYNPSDTSGKLRDLVVSIKTPYLLFIGTIEPRKNLEALCYAFLKSAFFLDGYKLVIAGAQGWGNVDLPDNASIIITGKISNKERAHLLAGAGAFVFPSLFEGFGMPVIEAMQSKVPVVASSSSSLREIVNTNNSYPISHPFSNKEVLISLDELHADITNKSSKHHRRAEQAQLDAGRYTWKHCADTFLEIILD